MKWKTAGFVKSILKTVDRNKPESKQIQKSTLGDQVYTEGLSISVLRQTVNIDTSGQAVYFFANKSCAI